uniref:Uncharacterized protein n=2 Tax=Magallana gigas TaxID=29159 RepID=K1QFF6_MAGGI
MLVVSSFAHSARLIVLIIGRKKKPVGLSFNKVKDMVKRDKVDILDLFLENGVDIGHFLSEEGQAFTKPRLIEDNTIPVFSQSHVMNDLTPPYDPVIESIAGSSQSSSSVYDSSDGFQHLDDSVSSQFTYDDLDSSQAFFAEEVSKTELDIDLSPLLKQEIKQKIKNRRRAEGKEEIRIEFKEPSPERLTEEEEERRRVKREKNKMAAQKCRSKKRKLADTLEEETMKLEEKQEKLQEEVQKLREEREHLMELLKIHSQVCPKMSRLGS